MRTDDLNLSPAVWAGGKPAWKIRRLFPRSLWSDLRQSVGRIFPPGGTLFPNGQ
jgi:hypothetical protein